MNQDKTATRISKNLHKKNDGPRVHQFYDVTGRTLRTLIKWAMIGVVVFYLWYFKFFVFVFIWIPWLITYEVSFIIEWGLQPTLTYHWQWWTAAGLSILFLIIFEYNTHYRHKRRDLLRGGQYEGRVIWVRGSNEGLVYDIWNVKNYISWKLGKKKGSVSPTTSSYSNTVCIPGTWPDPFTIGLGERTTDDYVVYFRRFFYQLFVPYSWDKLYVSRDLEVVPSFFAFWFPRLRMVREPHPSRPGRWVYRLLDKTVDGLESDPAEYTAVNRKALGRSQSLVKWALLSDADTQKLDYSASMPIPQMERSDEEFD